MKFSTRVDVDRVEVDRAELLKKATYIINKTHSYIDSRDENNACFFIGHLKVIMGLLGESNPYQEKYNQLKIRIDDVFDIAIV